MEENRTFLRSGRTYDDMTLRSNAANRHMLDWNNPENFEIKTLSVERQLEQLVKQVTTLVDGKPSNYRKGQSKSGQQLLEVRFKNIFWFLWFLIRVGSFLSESHVYHVVKIRSLTKADWLKFR